MSYQIASAQIAIVFFLLTTGLPAFDQAGLRGSDFAKQVVPLLTKAGCNSGACHGAAAGRGYLTLSLYGSRPTDDYEALLHAPGGRYLDFQQPADSLLLQKPSGFLEHGGGIRLPEGEADFQELFSWIKKGCRQGTLANLQQLVIEPRGAIAATIGQPAQIRIHSRWSDGSILPAARWLVVDGAKSSTQDPAAQVTFRRFDETVEFTANEAGYWPVQIRLGNMATTVQLWARTPEVAGLVQASPDKPPASIDDFVGRSNARVGQAMAHPTKPHLLARRLWLDLLGRHPQPDEWQTATQQIETGQLAALVDRLLETKAFSKRAGEEIAGWIANASQIKSPAERSAQLIDSIADFLQSSDNVRELAREMLSVQEPRATRLNAFHTFASDPRSRAELVASVFMGVRIGCAQCHDHPLDRWTQDDYFAMAACWSEIDAGMQIKRIAGRTTTDLRSGRVAIARLPYSDVAYTAEEPADLAFANWICGEQNHFFAPNIVNRIWFWLMGEGLVDDVDDHRPTNPAINPELLEYLSIQLTENQGSLRSLVRQIVLSDAYARESDRSAERLAHRLCAIRIPRAIRQPMAELAIQALGISDRDELPETNHQESMMLQPVLEPGCSRGHPCSDPVSDSLSLVAGHDLNAAVRTAVRTASTSAQGVAPDSLQSVQLLQEFHLRLYGQEMPAADRDKWERAFATMPTATQQEMVEDILWSWIVSPNFSLLH